MRPLKQTSDVSLKVLDNGAIKVHWPRSSAFVQEIFKTSAVWLRPPATRILWISSLSLKRSTPGFSRASSIGVSVRQRHDCPAWLAFPYNSSAQFSRLLLTPPTTTTKSGVCFTHMADAHCRAVGKLGSDVQLQNDITKVRFSGPSSLQYLDNRSGQVMRKIYIRFFS